MAANDYTRSVSITPQSSSYSWSTPPSWITIIQFGASNDWVITIAANTGAYRSATISVTHSNGVTTDSINIIQEGVSSGGGAGIPTATPIVPTATPAATSSGGAGIPTATPIPAPTATPPPTSSGGAGITAYTYSVFGTDFYSFGNVSYINQAGEYRSSSVGYNQTISICARSIISQSGCNVTNTYSMCF
jgi:hypothetical protein